MSAVSLLLFARCAGFVARAPGFSHPSVPPPVRAAFALLCTVLLLPAAGAATAPLDATLVPAIAAEAGIGAAIGFAAGLLYDGAYAGGRMLDDYVGIRGSAPDAPEYAASAFGRIWSLVFTASFFLLGGYRVVVAALGESLARIPLGTVPSSARIGAFAVALPVEIAHAALLVAGPAIALVFCAQAALGALSRAIPRFASFTLSFPLVFGCAVTATLLAIPLIFGAGAHPWILFP